MDAFSKSFHYFRFKHKLFFAGESEIMNRNSLHCYVENVVSARQHNFQMLFIGRKGFLGNIQVVEFPISGLFEHLCDLCNTTSMLNVYLLEMWILSLRQPYRIRNSAGESHQSVFQQTLEVIVLPLKFEDHYCKASSISSD